MQKCACRWQYVLLTKQKKIINLFHKSKFRCLLSDWFIRVIWSPWAHLKLQEPCDIARTAVFNHSRYTYIFKTDELWRRTCLSVLWAVIVHSNAICHFLTCKCWFCFDPDMSYFNIWRWVKVNIFCGPI